MKLAFKIAASLVIGLMFWMGVVWILQGINVIPGSFMTGDIKWTFIGAALDAAALGLSYWLNRGPRAT